MTPLSIPSSMCQIFIDHLLTYQVLGKQKMKGTASALKESAV